MPIAVNFGILVTVNWVHSGRIVQRYEPPLNILRQLQKVDFLVFNDGKRLRFQTRPLELDEPYVHVSNIRPIIRQVFHYCRDTGAAGTLLSYDVFKHRPGTKTTQPERVDPRQNDPIRAYFEQQYGHLFGD